jgi:hypothetical protein
MQINGVALHHDSAQPHTAAAGTTIEAILKLKFELLHPANSPASLITIFSDHSK